MGCTASAANLVYPLPSDACLPSKAEAAPAKSTKTPIDIWNEVEEGSWSTRPPKIARDKCKKTIHIYVASTFSDFHSEREILVNKVFPEISKRCESLAIHFIPIDLRWGLTQEVQTADFVASCLKEINRCSDDGMPMFFIGLLSRMLGWVPSIDQISKEEQHLSGLSLIEMELIHGAYQTNNPNAIFAFRDSSFLNSLSVEDQKYFTEPHNEARIDFVKSKLKAKFPEQVFIYQCHVSSQHQDGLLKLETAGIFQTAIIEFFINKLRKEFFLETIPKGLLLQQEYHKQELKRLSAAEIVGKVAVIAKIEAYIENNGSVSPLLLAGEHGSGKSTIMAKCIQKYLSKEQMPALFMSQPKAVKSQDMAMQWKRCGHNRFSEMKCQDVLLADVGDDSSNDSLSIHDVEPEDSSWFVFYHFVGSIPFSSELRHILQRIWAIQGLGEPRVEGINYDVNGLAKDVLQLLSRTGWRKVILFIDGIDRVKDEYLTNTLKWIPLKLPHNIRIVLSVSSKSDARKILTSRESKCVVTLTGTLSLASSRKLIARFLSQYSVTPSSEIINLLLGKLGISNPLYIQEACKEIVHLSKFQMSMEEAAMALPGDLASLYDQIITRLEEDIDSRLVITTLCLLECAHHGMLESELLHMLGALPSTGYRSESSENPSRMSRMVARSTGPSHSPALYGTGSDFLTVNPCTNTMGIQTDNLNCINNLYSAQTHAQAQAQLRIPPGISQATLSDIDSISTIQHHCGSSSGARKGSSIQSLVLPGAVASTEDYGLSPKVFSSINEPGENHDLTSLDGVRRPNKLPPSPTLSLISAELNRKTITPVSSHHTPQGSELHVESEIQEVRPTLSRENINQISNRTLLMGLGKMNAMNSNSSAKATLLTAYSWALLFHKLRPFLLSIGRAGESRWGLGTIAFSRAVRKRYFKQPVTLTFPFSFCTSSMFFGSDKDTYVRNSSVGYSQVFSPTSFRSGLSLSRTSSTQNDLVQKRFDWWNARLASYFSVSPNEDRRAEELPYHLARIRDHGCLSHCLIHKPTFEQLSTEENIMDLLRLWKCTGLRFVPLYQHALEELEATGASAQEMVPFMQKLAFFFQHAGELQDAVDVLVKAIQLEVSQLGGRAETMAALTFSIAQILDLLSRLQETEQLDAKEHLEQEYRLLNFASNSVEYHRQLIEKTSSNGFWDQSLAQLLLVLTVHLQHYATLGGSAMLSSRSATEQAQEAAQEATDLFLKWECHADLLQAYIHLASAYSGFPRKALEFLKNAQHHCRRMFGELNDVMLRILYLIAVIYDKKLFIASKAKVYYERWRKLAVVIYGEDYLLSDLIRGYGIKLS